MSEILAEGRVLILPDTTGFRTQLLAEVKAAVAAASETAIVPIRVAAAGGEGVAGLSEVQRTLASSTGAATEALTAEERAITGVGVAAGAATAKVSQGQVSLAAATLQLERAQTAQFVASLKLASAQQTQGTRAAALERVQAKSGATTKQLAAAQAALEKADNAVTVAEQRLAQATSATSLAQARRASIIKAQAAADSATVESEAAAAKAAARHAQTTRSLAQAQTAGATATAKLAAAQTTVVGASSEVAAAEIRQTRAVAAAAAGERALQKALAAKNIGLIDAASNTLRLANAEEAEALAALSGARAQTGRAATLGAAGRAAAAFGAGAAGLRGSVIGAQLPFIATIAGIAVIAKSIKEASDLNEEINKSEVVFKNSAAAIQEWSKTTATSIGISRVAALRAAGAFGNILVPLGVLPRQAAIMSQTFVKLASDMASFNNASPERTLAALQSGLVGQSRPLRVFGVQLTAARVAEEAMRETGKRHAEELTQEDKVLARYSLTLQDAAIQVGDFQRTQSRLANQTRQLSAELADLGGTTGRAFVPLVTGLVHGINQEITGLEKLAHAAKDFGKAFNDALRAATPGGRSIFDQIGDVRRIGHDFIESKFALLGWKEATKTSVSSTEQLKGSLADLGDQARKTGGPSGIVALSGKLQDLITGFAEGGPKGRQFSEALARVLADVQRLGQQSLKIPLDVQFALALADIRVQESGVLGEIGADFNSFAAANPVKLKIGLDVQFQLAEAVGASDQTKLAIAKKQRDDALRTIRRILRLGPETTAQEVLAAAATAKVSESQQKAFSDAVSKASAAESEIETITGKQATDAQARARKRAENARKRAEAAKKAAAAAKKAQDDQNQAFLDSLAGPANVAQRAIDKAGSTKRLSDDIAANKQLVAIEKATIAAINERIRSLHLHGDQLKAARDAIKAAQQVIFNTNLEIDRLTKEQTANRQAAVQAARDARQAHLNALLQIAQTTERTSDDRRAIEAIIKFDEQQIARLKRVRHRTREQNAQLDGYRVDLAQQEKALRDLTAQVDKNKNAAQQAQFAFLQTQAGFAANLLGNLIPLGATGNLVGGTTAGGTSGAFPKIPSDVGQTDQNIQRRGVQDIIAGRAAAAEGRNIGPTRVGQTREIHILNEIRRLLHEIHRGNGHPEATHRRSVNRRGLSEFGYSGSHNG